eukprot:TRINITY_DN2064_c0_g1_i1.p1 TRINITY_DN2064_c0_g1~~TRINITY_DN2064_c0_g1_i1.p1  ORF type:complete len:1070 (+),score=353.15 TRINITY_DN2064_c0_g1_i1:118-3327(+)
MVMDALRSVIGGKKKDDSADAGKQRPPRRKKYYDKISSISIPSYHLTKSGHVDYVIEVKKAGTTWQVLRRYSMFKKLHADLTSLCPMTTPYHCEHGVVPVLCGSSWTEVTNQSINLIEKRKFYLEVYLEQLLVCKNRFYQARTALYSFLHDDEVAVMNKPGTTPLPGLGASGGKVDDALENSMSVVDAVAEASQDPALPAAAPTPTPPAHVPSTANLATTSMTMKIPTPGDQHDDPMVSLRSDPGPSYLSLMHPEALSESPALQLDLLLDSVCEKCGAVEQIGPQNFKSVMHCLKCDAETKHALKDSDTLSKLPPNPQGPGSDHQGSLAPSTGGRSNRPKWAGGDNCEGCSGKFSFLLRKHHCRRCGGIFCGYCSSFTHELPDLDYSTEVRVCKTCKDALVQHENDDADKAPVVTSSELLAPGSGNEGDTFSDYSGPMESDHGYASTHEAKAGSEEQAQDKQFSAEDFELVTTLGKGTFGKVMKVRERSTGDMFAMKVLSKKVVQTRRMVEYVREEKDILSSLSHPFIVHLNCAFQTAHHLYILMDFLPGGELYSHIYNQGRFGEVDAKFYISEMVLAIGYLHSRDIVHRDIKPENIVLDRQGHAVLTDFGLAKRDFSKATRRSFVGSSEYLSPETVKGEPQTAAVDWWSIGILLYEMLVGSAPFNGPNNANVYQQILHKEISFTHIKSKTCQDVIKSLLTRDVSQRLATEESIKAHAFFADVDWEALLLKKVTPPFVPDLSYNDTKYFSKEFTHEWATVPSEDDKTGKTAGRSTLDLLSSKFDNFAIAGKTTKATTKTTSPPGPAALQPTVTENFSAASFRANHPLNMTRLGSMQELDACTPAAILVAGVSIKAREPAAQDLLHPRELIVGAWTLRSLEIVSETGKVSYPWGSEVLGQAIYYSNGQYSCQCTMTKAARSKFKDDDYKRVDREEMAEAYLTYVSSFGTYHIPDDPRYVSHFLAGSLCPNWADAEQKRYFRFVDTQGAADKDHLILATGVTVVDDMKTRTVMKFQRQIGAEPAHPAFAKAILDKRAAAAAEMTSRSPPAPNMYTPVMEPQGVPTGEEIET